MAYKRPTTQTTPSGSPVDLSAINKAISDLKTQVGQLPTSQPDLGPINQAIEQLNLELENIDPGVSDEEFEGLANEVDTLPEADRIVTLGENDKINVGVMPPEVLTRNSQTNALSFEDAPLVYMEGMELGPTVDIDGIATPGFVFKKDKLLSSTDFVAAVAAALGTTPVVVALMLGFKVIGDSLDKGFLTSDPATKNWASRAYNQLDATRISAPNNYAQEGNRLIQEIKVNQLDAALLQIEADMVKNPGGALLVVGGGTNDFYIFDTSVADCIAALIAIATKVRNWQAAHNNYPIKLIRKTVPANRGTEGIPSNAEFENRRQQLKAAERANYSAWGYDSIINLDANPLLQDPTNLVIRNPDRIHFTDQGQLECGNTALPVLLAAMQGTLIAPAADAVVGVTQLAKPSLMITRLSQGSYSLIRSNVANAESYVLQRATDAGFTANVVTTDFSAATSIGVAGLTVGSKYWFQTKAHTSAQGFADSDYAQVSVTVDADAPAPVAFNAKRLFHAEDGTLAAEFAWPDQTGSGDVLKTSTVANVKRIAAPQNGLPFWQVSTRLLGQILMGLGGSTPFAYIVGCVPIDAGADANANIVGMGADVGDGSASGTGGTIACMLTLGGKLCIHTLGEGVAGGQGLNDTVAPSVTMPTSQVPAPEATFGVIFDGTNAFSYVTGKPLSSAYKLYRANQQDTVLSIGAGPFDIGNDFNNTNFYYKTIIVLGGDVTMEKFMAAIAHSEARHNA
jgi:hypothetical protein